jgi:ribonucleoside-triphosphate reductase
MVTRQRVECYSRITGFIRPISQYNPGKLSEFKDRKVFNVSKALLK